jgi:hypothetical protein
VKRSKPLQKAPVRADLVFARLPLDLLSDRLLLPIDKVIGGILADFASPRSTCWPVNRTIAARAGCSPATVRRALARLEDLGWIGREPNPSLARGALIRLNWTLAGGRSPVSGGVLTGERGGCSPVRTNPRTSKPDLEPGPLLPLRDPEPEGPLSPAELEQVRRFASDLRHPLRRWAERKLESFEQDSGAVPLSELLMVEKNTMPAATVESLGEHGAEPGTEA